MPVLTAAEICHLLTAASPDDLASLIGVHQHDGRASVLEAVARAERRLARESAEQARLDAMAELQSQLHARGYALVAGVDEVGRGCIAGPVSAAAVIIPVWVRIPGLNDSKKLTPQVRSELDVIIRAAAAAVCVAHIAPSVIDSIGIVGANLLAMRQALAGLGVGVDHVIVDGLPVNLGVPSTAVVRGDSRVSAIAAASIVAKVARDELMKNLDAEYPEYGFALNKGYGTVEHISIVDRIGPCAIHRMSFAPCSQRSLF